MPKFYITTPVYYVNDVPHIGHTYTTVAADVLARWRRLMKDEVFFLTGTDEHGAKIENKAAEMKLAPQQYSDEIAAKFQKAWQELNVSNDNFLRTTNPAHIRAVGKALQQMHDRGDIYLGKYQGLYCRGCEQYKSERDLVDGLCPDHKVAPEKMSEECYNFKLSKYQERLLALIKKDQIKILPVERKNEIVSFYEKEGLEDVSFSRKNIKWGVPIPWDKSHTTYVWADAFLNYLTGLGWDGKAKKSKIENLKSKMFMWPPTVQLMSKDILRVHTTIWPAMLLALGLPLPKTIFVHGYFKINGQKMSKSLGNVIAPGDLVKKYGTDASRFLVMSAAVFGHDGDISWEKFDDKYNADLANGLGNLVARVSNLIEKNNLELKIKLEVNGHLPLHKKYAALMAEFKFDEALKLLWQRLRQADETLSEKKPWAIKDAKAVEKILQPIAQDILNVAGLLKPFMPAIAEKIIAQFSAGQIKKGENLFPRI
ncbi:MAG: methionine--tRNA ligase [Patescibacteria group bacterium]|nr:methionine--tRNA ligase [Patescibacteria group bacterium]